VGGKGCVGVCLDIGVNVEVNERPAMRTRPRGSVGMDPEAVRQALFVCGGKGYKGYKDGLQPETLADGKDGLQPETLADTVRVWGEGGAWGCA